MSNPIELCIKCQDKPDDERFYKCTARTGREAGLTLQLDGTVGWCVDGGSACDIWVSDDGRLLIHRRGDAPDIYIVRRGRRILLPEDRMAFLRNRDELSILALSFRIHVHGAALEVHPPRLVRVIGAAALTASLTFGTAACYNVLPPNPELAEEQGPRRPRLPHDTSVTEGDTETMLPGDTYVGESDTQRMSPNEHTDIGGPKNATGESNSPSEKTISSDEDPVHETESANFVTETPTESETEILVWDENIDDDYYDDAGDVEIIDFPPLIK